MNRNTLILSHLGAAALGAAAVALLDGGRQEHASSQPEIAEENGVEAKDARPSAAFSSNEYRAGLNHISGMRIHRHARTEAEQLLIQEWLRSDFQAAVRALLETDLGRRGGGKPIPIELLEENRDWLLAELEAGSFGLEAGVVAQWLLGLALTPELSWALLEYVPGSQQDKLMEVLLSDSATRSDWMERLKASPSPRIRSRAWICWVKASVAENPDGMTYPEVLRELENAPASLKEPMFEAFVKQIAWGKERAETLKRVMSFPDDLREDALAMMGTWGMRKGSVDAAIQSLDAFVAAEAWTAVEHLDLRAVMRLSRNYPERCAEWAVNLEPRREVEGLFDATVVSFLAREPVAAKNWLSEMDPGWHRDRALLKLASISLSNYMDPALHEWARELIGDPDLRTQADAHRAEWENAERP